MGEIETASISTIHSFCTQLLKEYNDNAGATMNPRVLKDAEKKRMLDECFTDAAEQIFSQKDHYTPADRQAVGYLMTAFSPEELRDMVSDSGGWYSMAVPKQSYSSGVVLHLKAASDMAFKINVSGTTATLTKTASGSKNVYFIAIR